MADMEALQSCATDLLQTIKTVKPMINKCVTEARRVNVIEYTKDKILEGDSGTGSSKLTIPAKHRRNVSQLQCCSRQITIIELETHGILHGVQEYIDNNRHRPEDIRESIVCERVVSDTATTGDELDQLLRSLSSQEELNPSVRSTYSENDNVDGMHIRGSHNSVDKNNGVYNIKVFYEGEGMNAASSCSRDSIHVSNHTATNTNQHDMTNDFISDSPMLQCIAPPRLSAEVAPPSRPVDFVAAGEEVVAVMQDFQEAESGFLFENDGHYVSQDTINSSARSSLVSDGSIHKRYAPFPTTNEISQDETEEKSGSRLSLYDNVACGEANQIVSISISESSIDENPQTSSLLLEVEIGQVGLSDSVFCDETDLQTVDETVVDPKIIEVVHLDSTDDESHATVNRSSSSCSSMSYGSHRNKHHATHVHFSDRDSIISNTLSNDITYTNNVHHADEFQGNLHSSLSANVENETNSVDDSDHLTESTESFSQNRFVSEHEPSLRFVAEHEPSLLVDLSQLESIDVQPQITANEQNTTAAAHQTHLTTENDMSYEGGRVIIQDVVEIEETTEYVLDKSLHEKYQIPMHVPEPEVIYVEYLKGEDEMDTASDATSIQEIEIYPLNNTTTTTTTDLVGTDELNARSPPEKVDAALLALKQGIDNSDVVGDEFVDLICSSISDILDTDTSTRKTSLPVIQLSDVESSHETLVQKSFQQSREVVDWLGAHFSDESNTYDMVEHSDSMIRSQSPHNIPRTSHGDTQQPQHSGGRLSRSSSKVGII